MGGLEPVLHPHAISSGVAAYELEHGVGHAVGPCAYGDAHHFWESQHNVVGGLEAGELPVGVGIGLEVSYEFLGPVALPGELYPLA